MAAILDAILDFRVRPTVGKVVHPEVVAGDLSNPTIYNHISSLLQQPMSVNPLLPFIYLFIFRIVHEVHFFKKNHKIIRKIHKKIT